MKYMVYLVGALTEDPATHLWRDMAADLLSSYFEINNPGNSLFDKRILEKSGGVSEKFYKFVRREASDILLPKSFMSVLHSDIILANLELEPLDRPLIGSIMEIAWAFDHNKTIVAIKGDNFYCKHPMIVKAVCAWAKDVKEACDIIKQFFCTVS